MVATKVPAGLGKSQKAAVGLQGLIQQSDANTGDNAGIVPVAANMDGGRTRRKRRRTKRRTRRKRRRTKRRTRRRTKRRTKRRTRRKRRRTKRKRRRTKRKRRRTRHKRKIGGEVKEENIKMKNTNDKKVEQQIGKKKKKILDSMLATSRIARNVFFTIPYSIRAGIGI